MKLPSFFVYLEFLLADNFARLSYANFFAKPRSASEFSQRFSFNLDASERYLRALSHFKLLQQRDSKFIYNSNYQRSQENDELFSKYRSFQVQLSSSNLNWPYEHGKDLRAFDLFAENYPKELYWSLKYQVLVMNQFFQDHVIAAALRTGRSQTKLALGISRDQIFENYASNPNLLETYAEGFAHGQIQNNVALAKSLNFLGPIDYLDIGGGNGSQALAIRVANPELRSVSVLDLPEAELPLKASRERWSSYFNSSVNWIPDNFFSSSFAQKIKSRQKFGCITLSWILHDWSDEQCLAILERTKSLLDDLGHILVIEKLKTATNLANVQDFLMMIMADGFERTAEDYSSLFSQSGLSIEKLIKPSMGRDIMVLKSV